MIYGEPINTLHRQDLYRLDESADQKLHFSLYCGYAVILGQQNRENESSLVLTYNEVKILCRVSLFAKVSASMVPRAACK